MNRSALLVAYHFPPIKTSSGLQRTLSLTKYLPRYGWDTNVLTVSPRAYANTSDTQMSDIPVAVHVKRAWCLDVGRHFSVAGRYIDSMALPDRWNTWLLSGVFAGMRMISRYRPDVLWATYPIASAHLIGLVLHRLSGIPVVADYRDLMTEENDPPHRVRFAMYRWIERNMIERCSRAVFTAPGTLRMYRERYPEVPEERLAVIENGFDEANFQQAGEAAPGHGADHVITLVHSGTLYSGVRNPECFFRALSELNREGAFERQRLNVVLRASGHDALYRRMFKDFGIEDIVTLEPDLAYADALAEMLHADGLLLFQGSLCNHQIPAKVYEYIRARRPIFALTDPVGDTARVLRGSGYDSIVALDDTAAIKQGLQRFMHSIVTDEAFLPREEDVERHDRAARARELAAMLDEIVQGAA